MLRKNLSGTVLLFLLITTFCFAIATHGEAAVRTYYIAADAVDWDYTPSGMNLITNKPFGEDEKIWLNPGATTFGSKFRKALYHEYTDETFKQLKPRSPQWEHLGSLGPLIRAEVGDTIRVVFKNNVDFPASVHPHGVFYKKDSEGAPYEDSTSGSDKADDAVPPGGTHVYTWEARERTGPMPGEGSTALWMYHSHTDEARDINSGLIGPMIITAKGMGREDLSPKDVDREFVIAFQSTEEAQNHYIEHNLETYLSDPSKVTIVRDEFGARRLLTGTEGPPVVVDRENLNGFMYGNLPMLTMKKGEQVRWYLLAGTNFELHAPHWHGNTGILMGMRVDTTSLLTMGMQIVNMQPDAVGTWLFHCHVYNHFMGGMVARYRVEE
ncbi:MAG TPA: multicopper oxidase domain-containing protein [Acidobacteriota bacterium]|nr:multicopper oxidase domain-containing protein [Acidobacteriota bacterium]